MNQDTSTITPYEAGTAASTEEKPAGQSPNPPVLPTSQAPSHPTLASVSAHMEEAEDEPSTNKAELYPRILRWVGAGILGVAALCFMVSGWVQGSPLVRTGSFLGFTALLTGAGIFCAYRWREDKGARTFLALACAFLPANFAQLGALIYAEVHGSTGYNVGMRKIFTFTQVGELPLIVAGLISLVVLVPVAYTGFSALARTGAKKMTALFLGANALLLLPWRDANVVALLGAGMVAVLVFADRKWFAKESALRTWDGVAMRTLLFTPVGLLLARNLIMHEMTYGMFSVCAGMTALLFFSGVPRCLPWEKGRVASQLVGYACAWGAWLCALLEIFPDWPFWKNASLPLVFLPWCMAVFGLSFIGKGKGVVARGLASVVAFAVCWANLEYFGSLGYTASVIALLAAIALLLAAFLLEEKVVLVSGSALLLVSIGYHIHYALSLVQENLWLSLAVAGASVILASSYLERHGIGLRQRALRLRRHWQAWQ